MKVKYLFKMAALFLVAALSSCSSDDFTETGKEPDTPMQTVQFTATIGQKGEGTRGLKDEGTYIDAFWKIGERVAVVSKNDKRVLGEAEVTAVDGNDGSAIISGPLEGAANGAVTLIYPASAVNEETGDIKENLLDNQLGTLKDIEEKYDVATTDGTLSVNGSEATLEEQVSFENQNAICKFKFNNGDIDNIMQLTISNANTVITTVTLAEPTTEIYVAMAVIETASTLKFELQTTDDDIYTTTATAKVGAGKFYDLNLGGLKNTRAVDLDLPSGNNWAKWNVGAESETDYGLYFAWADPDGYTIYDEINLQNHSFTWNNYIWSNTRLNEKTKLTKYCTNGSYSGTGKWDDANHVYPGDNVAAAWGNIWGTSWTMPTEQDWQELIDNTTSEWTDNYKESGIAGLILTSKTNHQSIFLPAGGRGETLRVDANSKGYYWANLINWDEPCDAYYFQFDSNNSPSVTEKFDRCFGLSIRAVQYKQK